MLLFGGPLRGVRHLRLLGHPGSDWAAPCPPSSHMLVRPIHIRRGATRSRLFRRTALDRLRLLLACPTLDEARFSLRFGRVNPTFLPVRWKLIFVVVFVDGWVCVKIHIIGHATLSPPTCSKNVPATKESYVHTVFTLSLDCAAILSILVSTPGA
ncbi:hypothetical protein PGTUg99_001246 [Puccinia graminis f. sp. tritici]|uniref:Uncharacterized protein n=1 Tax=Puccinia graminis f. sp. tritici TaxID=56615 RepID=A0A5B0S9R8_PUCGR|nr:hypothetical protein PGTUg99_001246 [Puccinia graminis f. sp. tritici]